MGKLDGKVAIVTGGGSGIGEATSILFAREGARVIIADMSPENGDRVAKLIKQNGGYALFVKVDVSNREDAQKMVNAAIDNYGRLDILFNNAGAGGPMVLTADYDEEFVDRMIAVNVKGVFLCTKYAIPAMLKTGGGSIISTSSVVAIYACKGGAMYSATKSAILGFSRSVAMEYAKQGIRSNTICPGPTNTAMQAQNRKSGVWDKIVSDQPMGRAAEPEDIAGTVLFLASNDSRQITAANIMVDGGVTVRGNA